MILLTNNKDLVTIESFAPYYANKIFIFEKSEHILDEEKTIQKCSLFTSILVDSTNYEFVDSKDFKMVQLSDIFLGVLRTLFDFLNSNSNSEIEEKICNLNPVQKNTLFVLQKIISKSLDENKAFKSSSVSVSFEEKFSFFLEYVF